MLPPPSDSDAADQGDSDVDYDAPKKGDTEVDEEKASIPNIKDYRGGRKAKTDYVQHKGAAAMTDSPSREEIAARLEAAEARTEARLGQMTHTMNEHALRTDYKIDGIASKLDALFEKNAFVLLEVKEENRQTRRNNVGAVLAIAALIVALWVAGQTVQSNLIAIFQAGLGTRAVVASTSKPVPEGPPAQAGSPKN